MGERTVSVAEAKARLSELVAAAEAGEEVVITKRGKPVVALVACPQPKKRVDLAWLRAMTDDLPMGKDSLPLIEQMRDDARY